MTELPFVSVLVPMRNERHYIGPCLDSILASDYPSNRLEVIVADGRSEDGSRDVVLEYVEEHASVRIVDNPKLAPGAGMNTALPAARGEVIVRMDAHALYPPDYVRRCVELLLTTGAANVGGVRIPRGEGYLGKAIAVATHHPFGIGHRLFRASGSDRWVDTVYLGAWRKETLEKIGGFREDFPQNQDAELNQRLRQAGGQILWSPKISYTYFVRRSIRALVRQYFRYGKGRVRTGVAHPGALSWRHYIPPALVLVLPLSLAGLPLTRYAVLPLVVYAGTTAAAAVHACLGHGLRNLPIVAGLFVMIHLTWGAGFWAGVLQHGIPWHVKRRRVT